MNRKNFLIATLVSVVLLTVVFAPISTQQSAKDYDPWCDLNDDGKIDIKDVATVAIKFGSMGTPINKTELLSWFNETKCLSIPPVAFNPRMEGFNRTWPSPPSEWDWPDSWFRDMFWLMCYADGDFYAPVQLPDGAEVLKLTFYYYDSSPTNSVKCTLYRTSLAIHSGDTMANCESYGSAGDGISYDDSIWDASIDNSNYHYCVKIDFPRQPEGDNDHMGVRGVVIDYVIKPLGGP